MRKAGILLPIFSLPNSYGIGTLGKEAYQFVDFLKKSHQAYWQVLPLGPTSYGDSPYQSFSVFAGNPYFIDLEMLVDDNLLTKEEIACLIDESTKINYEKLYNTKFLILRKAYERFLDKEDMNHFIVENSDWLEDYAIFMTLKNYYNGKSFYEWDDSYKLRKKEALEKIKVDKKEDISFWEFVQYIFFKQWNLLKKYANENGIMLIGDMPIYTSLDSSDVWSNSKEFQLDKDLQPKLVAGCPPDDFSPLGQLWGNPLYNYKEMKKNNYRWWVRRVEVASKLFDIIRIDHFRGFEAYFAIPKSEKDATSGKWLKGPNVDLFKQIEKQLGKVNIIAENLGFLTDKVQIMLDKLGYPGMKVLEFGFDPKGDSDAMPHNLSYNMVVYPGTHDNMPIRAWYDSLDFESKKFVKDYLYFNEDYDVGNRMIRACLASPAKMAIISFPDYLQKGLEARINTPSTLGTNWCWRMEKGDMNDDLANYISYLQKIYRRTN